MKDVRFFDDEFQFLLRVSVLIFNKEMNKVLLFNVEGRKVHMLPGGKAQQLEESLDAVKREVKEELGWDNLDYSFLCVSEEFVNDKGYNNQQINLIYKAIYNDEIVEENFKGLEGDWINFKWVDVDKLDEYELYPRLVRDMAKSPDKIYHSVNNLIRESQN